MRCCVMTGLLTCLLLCGCGKNDPAPAAPETKAPSENPPVHQTQTPQPVTPDTASPAGNEIQQTISEALKLVQEKNYRGFAEKLMPPEERANLDRFVTQMEKTPERGAEIQRVLEQAQKATPEMLQEGKYALYRNLTLPAGNPGDPEKKGYLVLMKVDDRWVMADSREGQFDLTQFEERVNRRNPNLAPQHVREMNQVKQVMLALHNYHDAHKTFPTDIKDESGKPLLSWRVAILPFLEQTPLHDQFRLNEPWDSEHNLKVAQQMPEVYKFAIPVPASDSKVPLTHLLAPKGKGTVLGDQRPVGIRHVTDGTVTTVVVVVSAASTEWTRPDDLEYDPQNPVSKLFNDGMSLLMAGFADGAVRNIPKSIDPTLWHKLFVRDDGQVLPRF